MSHIRITQEMVTLNEANAMAIARDQLGQRMAEIDGQYLVDLGFPEHLVRPISIGQYRESALAAGYPQEKIDEAVAATAAYLARILPEESETC